MLRSFKIEKFFAALSSNSGSIFEKLKTCNISEGEIKDLTGFELKNIQMLVASLKSMRNTTTRTVFQALIVFLFKLKTGASQRVTAALFGLPHASQVSDMFSDVIDGFKRDLLSTFGIERTLREDLLTHRLQQDNC